MQTASSRILTISISYNSNHYTTSASERKRETLNTSSAENETSSWVFILFYNLFLHEIDMCVCVYLIDYQFSTHQKWLDYLHTPKRKNDNIGSGVFVNFKTKN